MTEKFTNPGPVTMKGGKFSLGSVSATRGVFDLDMELIPYLKRHNSGDWGDICSEDWELNDDALEDGGRLFSAYETPAGKIWIITEADRSVTTILLPKEY